eukprot:332302_1
MALWNMLFVLVLNIGLVEYVLSMNTIGKLYDQRVDHFNAYNADKTFKQRWYYNDTYWSGSNNLGPIIYQIGGEGANGGGVYGFVENLVPLINGLVVTAEHRYYGQSNPYNPQDKNYNPNSNYLGLLSLEQAMADYMELLYFWKNEYFNCTKCPVIVLGGSYSGKLSFYLRLKYPYLFDIALAASAPIFLDSNGIVNPNAFYEIITNATNKISPTCVNYIKAAYDILMFDSTPKQITDTIPLCYPLSDNINKGLNEVLALLYMQFANFGMFNYPPQTSPLKNACMRILNGTINDGLLIWNRFLEPFQTASHCINLTQFTPNGGNGTIHCSDLTGCGRGYAAESWDYQACTEVIQPIGSNNVTDMFPVFPFNMTWMDEHCVSRFGVKSSPRSKWLEQEFGFNPVYFYNKLPNITSYVIFSNGLLDGWSAGGVVKNMSDTLIAIVMPNGAHHVDMHSSTPYDTQDVIDARKQENSLLIKWTKQLQKERQLTLQ